MTNYNSIKDVKRLVSKWNTKETVWLFDYDQTLYGFDERRVLGSLDKGITQFICKFLNLSVEKADETRRQFWESHGTTLAGLMAQSDVDPHDYFDFIHHYGTIFKPRLAPQKRPLLENIKGPRHIFTNARKDWALSGVTSMGLESYFERYFDIEYFGWTCKPDVKIYDSLIKELELEGKTVVFIEDSAKNLIPAIERGWKTVLLSNEPCEGPWDLNLKSLEDLLAL
jgi:putative hydrolase of the HAD superfamily